MSKPTSKKAVPLKVFGKGGKATFKKYGREHMRDLALRMHAKRKRALAAKKKAAATKKR